MNPHTPHPTLYANLIDNELAHHPASTLIDIYKLFMQSTLGPGHLIPDPDTARQYLHKELNEHKTYISRFALDSTHPYITAIKPKYTTKEGTAIICPCLALDCDAVFPFARYSLKLLQDKVIPFETYFDAFIETANTCQKLDFDLFSSGWQGVLDYLTDIHFTFIDDDIQKINQAMYQLVSHSQTYNQIYHPSYRVINKCFLVDFEDAIRERYFILV